MDFMSNMKSTLDDRKSITENGAVGYATTGHELLDLNFSVGSLRKASEESIKDAFAKAYFENPLYAVKWLFYCGDVRGGQGERRTFNVCVQWLMENKREVLKALLVLIPEYTRWDYLIKLIDSSLKGEVKMIIEGQIKEDTINMKEGKSTSLIGKWLYSEACSNKEHRRLAKILVKELGLTPKQYRKMLTKMRSYLNVVETKMSAKNWSEIDYEKVPSRANLIYNNAFLRNDEERRRSYLAALTKGEAKINSSVLFPHDIVHKYGGGYYDLIRSTDPAIEAMWKGLPDYVQGSVNTLVVGDGSGSMFSRVDPNSSVMAVDIADALAIYFAEHAQGQFANKYITFGGNPHLVDFSNCKTLRDKIVLARKNHDCSNTDIAKVFRLILNTAISNHMTQDNIPQNVLVVSDMEMDGGCYYGSRFNYCNTPTLFDGIAAEYAVHGYQLPKLIFWNVNSRTGTIPVKQNPAGVILVSGFSPAVTKMVLSNKTDPYEALIEVLDSSRYDAVEEAVKDVI